MTLVEIYPSIQDGGFNMGPYEESTDWTDSNDYVQNKSIYPAISTFAVQICYTNTFLLYSY